MNLRLNRFHAVAAAVGLSVILAYLMMTAAQWAKLYVNMRPESFARKNVSLYKKKLHLTPVQEEHLRAILLSHKQAANQMDQADLEQWEHLFTSLADSSDEDLHRQLQAINELEVRRNEHRLQTLLRLRQELNTDQKRQYGQYVAEVVQKYINMIIRIIR